MVSVCIIVVNRFRGNVYGLFLFLTNCLLLFLSGMFYFRLDILSSSNICFKKADVTASVYILGN